MRKYLKWMFLCLGLVLVFSCVGGKNQLNQFVPADSLAYLQIDNVEAFFENSDDFMEATGMKALLNGMGVESVIRAGLAMAGGSLDWLDLTKAAGVALLLPDTLESDPGQNLIIMLPVKDKGSYDLIKAFAEKNMKMQTEYLAKYALLFTNPALRERLTPKKTLDLKKLQAYKKGTLSVYTNFKNILSMTGMDGEQIKMSLLKGMSENMGSSGSSSMAPITAFLTNMADLIMELDVMNFNLAADGEGITVQNKIVTKKDGKMTEWSKKIKPGKGSKDYVRYISQDAMFSALINIPMDPIYEMYIKTFSALVAGQEEIPQVSTEILLESMKSMSGTFGPKMAGSLNFDLNFALLAGLMPGNTEMANDRIPAESAEKKMAIELVKSLEIDAYYVIDIKDIQKYKNSLDKFLSPDYMKDLLGEDYKNFPLEVIYQKDKNHNGFLYDSITYKILQNQADPVDREMLEMMSAMFSAMELGLHYINGKAYMYMGKNPAARLKTYVDNDGISDKTMALDNLESIKGFWEQIPNDSQVIMQYSVIDLLNFVSKALPDLIPEIRLEKSPGLISYTRIDKNICEGAVFWSSREIGAIITTFKDILPELMKLLR